MRRSLLTLLLWSVSPVLGSLAGAQASSPRIDSVRAQLERRYEENRDAFLKWNVAEIMALRAPGFHALGPDGAKQDRAAMEHRTVGLLNGIRKWNKIEFSLDSVRLSGDTAFVIMSQHLDREALQADNLVHHVETWATQREAWIRIRSQWFLLRVDQVRNQRRLIDGKSG